MFGTSKTLEGKNIAILATDGFEEAELFEPKDALEKAGAMAHVIAVKPEHKEEICAWKDGDWGKKISIDHLLEEVSVEQYDGLLLPGGVINSDTLRGNPDAVRFVTDFVTNGKPVAAICHALWLLIETGQIKGRLVTSWPALKTDLENAGARWVDQAVVTDQGWVSSRQPSDIPAFNKKMIEEFAEGRHHAPGAKGNSTFQESA